MNETIKTGTDGKMEGAVVQPESVMDKGQERYEKLSESLSNAKKNVSSWFKSGVAGMGRFFKGSAVAALSTPEATVAGGAYVAQKAMEGGQYVGQKLEQGRDFIAAKDAQLAEWEEGTWESASQFTDEKVKAIKEFISTKGGQVRNFATDKIELGQALASLASEKTAEGYVAVREGVISRWGKLMEFGKNSIAAAEQKRQQMANSFNQKRTSLKMALLERQSTIHQEKLAEIKAKMDQLRQVEGFENAVAA